MFRFLEISLFGWDLWPQCRVPVDRDVVLLTGPNGSGKTTPSDNYSTPRDCPPGDGCRTTSGDRTRPRS